MKKNMEEKDTFGKRILGSLQGIRRGERGIETIETIIIVVVVAALAFAFRNVLTDWYNYLVNIVELQIHALPNASPFGA